MSAAVIYVLTALAALVVLLTRLRLRGGGRLAGGARITSRLPFWHTLCGVCALIGWVIFLVAPSSSVLGGAAMGILGLGFWWLVAIVGVMILTRWLPSRGRHAGDGTADRWSGGPWLSLLAHGGMVVAVIVMTWAYLTQKV